MRDLPRTIRAGMLFLAAVLHYSVLIASDSKVEVISQVEALIKESELARSKSNFADGIGYAEEAVKLARASNLNELYCDAYFEYALQTYRMEDYDLARSRADIGLSKARFFGYQHIEADFLNLLAHLERNLGNLHKSVEYLLNALDIKEETGDFGGMSNLANNLGIMYFASKDFQAAIQTYENGLLWLEKAPNKILKAALLSNFAETLIQTRDFDKAEELLKESLEIEYTLDNPANLAFTYFNFGELYSMKASYNESLEYFQKALEIQSTLSSKWDRTLTILRIAQDKIAQSKAVDALKYLDLGMEDVKRVNANEMLRDYAEAYKRAYQLQNEKDLVVFYSHLSSMYDNSIKTDATKLDSVSEIAPPIKAKNDNAKVVQQTVLWILVIIAGFLAIENWRLRKPRRESKK